MSPTPFQTAARHAEDAHNNTFQLRTVLNIMAQLTDPTLTTRQKNHLLHNLINLEENLQALRLALIAAGVVNTSPVTDILDTIIAVGKVAEQIGDTWQHTGHEPPTNGHRPIDLVEIDGQIAQALD